ncbi:exopolysaccharide production protein ExoZ [Vibrio crassostreae]|uniref:acyltransferase family protein n=1 Tax=Vibrio crassostreae TaxID=246167 RepID=UPI000F4ABCFC|nr:acyltransferase [Vibrio crassostreae]ROO65737.1 peptidoglycan/LPS O-acetylase OafA/YrhL [Vibrio crassostreae]CAK3480598.1 exopolysaccharide production protein ExoZ [Vibrio crassostreae]CAK3610678.1 exopolysaccharide production protein ExoZ [Vibrio crassostreae]
MKSLKNNEIEVLRAIAIIMVVVAHLPFLLPWGAQWISSINTYTHFWGGVDIFFVISGFLITRSILNSKVEYHKKSEFIDFYKGFLLRRFFRLIPTSWFWVLFSVAAATFYNQYGFFGDAFRNLIDAVGNMFYLSNFRAFYCGQGVGVPCGINGKLWSLSLEEQFYFLFPIAIFIFRKNVALLLALIIIIQFPMQRIIGEFLWYFRTDAIAWGCLIAIFSRSKYYRNIKPTFLKYFPLRVITIVSLLIINILFARSYYSELTPYSIGVIALSSAILVWVASYDENLLFKGLSKNQITLWVASRSYSIYLCHGIGFKLVAETIGVLGFKIETSDTIGIMILGVMVTCILSEFSYKFIEKKFIAIGRNIINKRDSTIANSVGASS